MIDKIINPTHFDIWGGFWKIDHTGFNYWDGQWILCTNNRIWRQHLKEGNIFEL